MSDHLIKFLPDGTGITLHTDAIDLAALGRLEVTRASTVEFHEAIQLWQVWTDRGLLFSSPSRAKCLAFEQRYFNEQLLNQ